jgi:hypothetical protein
MITQRIYAGWDLFGILIAAALIATAAHTWSLRYERTAAFSLSASACILIVISQIIFWTFTYPMNALTENWTVMPADFVSARRQWEYSHAVNAIVTLMAFLAAVGSVILSRRPS